MKWFRFYTEVIDDPKLKNVSDKSFRVMISLFCLAADSNAEGEIPMKKDDIIWRLRLSDKALSAAVDELSEVNIINNSYPLRILNWSKRQYKSDNVNERVKRYRAVTRNVSNTLHETAPEQNRTDTETEKDTDSTCTDTKKQKIEFLNDVFINIPDTLKTKWQKSCPGIDIHRELSKAEAWVLSNPKLKKSNWSRFLTNWMVRSQDYARKEGGSNGNRSNTYRRYSGADRRDTELPADVQAIIDEINARSTTKAAASPADGEE